MIKATVNKGELSGNVEGTGVQVLSEITVLVNAILDKIADEDEVAKNELVETFCNNLKYVNEKEN